MIRPLKKEEIKAASDLGDEIYPSSLSESLESFEKRFLLFPKGFLGLFDGKKLAGYIIGHPWKGEDVVPLDYLGELPDEPDCFYIHDLAVSPSLRRKGFGRKLIETAIDVGKNSGFKKFMLVAVNEKAKCIFEKFGFKLIKEISYGDGVKSYKMIGLL